MDTQNEIFKDIPDWEGYYQASTLGRIKSLERKVRNKHGWRTLPEKILKLCNDAYGYPIVILSKNGIVKTNRVAHLVWSAFGNKPRNGHQLQVDHISGIKTDNRIENLQLLTNRDNVSKGFIQNGNKTSQYTGVSWYKRTNKWVAIAPVINGKQKYLGSFNDEFEAHLCYQKALSELKKQEF